MEMHHEQKKGKQMTSTNSQSSSVGGSFSLVDHDGNSVTEAMYRGSWMIVFFGFTHCRMVCPRALARLSSALDNLGGDARSFTPLYVTVDPERDTPDVMRRFLAQGYSRFTGLTGEQDAIDEVKKSFHVFARRADDPLDPDGYAVPHSAITYVFDPDGNFAAHFNDALDTDEVTERLRALIASDS